MILKTRFTILIWMTAICLAACAFFFFLYHHDNKYTTEAPLAQNGVYMLENTSDEGDVFWLINGWEFYPDQLIVTADNSAQYVPMYIGQYFSFSQFHTNGSPYGIGSYRLLINGNGTYLFLLPEVFSACTVYIEGEPIAASGSVTPYRPLIKDLVFSFTIDGTAEIVIETANYSHYYSGITYPPAIGSAEAINHLITARMLYYGFLVFTSFALAIFTSVLWIGIKHNKNAKENFWLGILAFTFSLRLCYPFIHTVGSQFLTLPYILENTTAAIGLFCIVRIVCLLCLKNNCLTERILLGLCFGFVVINAVFPIVIMQTIPTFASIYGQFFFWYKLLISITMVVILLLFYRKNPSKQTLLLFTGVFVYQISLIAHAYCLGHYEPARFGWFEEWGTYALIVCFAVRMILLNIQVILENNRLNKHLQEEVERHTQSLSKLLEERKLLLSGFAHDLKTPITSITTFTRLVEMDNTHLDDESREYLTIIRRKTSEIQDQLSALHEFTYMDAEPTVWEIFDFCELVQTFFEKNKPDVEVTGIQFLLKKTNRLPIWINGDKRKLTSVLQNLVYNAVSFTPPDGTIQLTIKREQDFAVLDVEDTGTGIAESDLPHIFDRFFTLRKKDGGNGMGLFIVKSILTEHHGHVEVHSVVGKGTVFTIKLPTVTK